MTFLADIQRKQREAVKLRERILEAAENAPPAESGVNIPRELNERLARVAERAGVSQRRLAAALLQHALEQAEPLFAPPAVTAQPRPARANGAGRG